MKLNRVETILMNNPIRKLIQRTYEAHLLMKLGGKVDGLKVLEIGCGRGVGTEIILDQFNAASVQAFDLDIEMVKKARVYLSRYSSDRVSVGQGDASQIKAADSSFDAVFDFGIIHHIPDWLKAVAEVARVLKPGGKFYFEEVTKNALDRWVYRTFLEHPSVDRFTSQLFIQELEKCGLSVGNQWVERFFGDFVIGVARKGNKI